MKKCCFYNVHSIRRKVGSDLRMSLHFRNGMSLLMCGDQRKIMCFVQNEDFYNETVNISLAPSL